MRICNKNPVHSYFINDFELPMHTFFKDLGIICNVNMRFNTHINTICTKAHLSMAYYSYVRPIVESDSSVWNPENVICNSNNIEKILIYFTKILFYKCNIIEQSYDDKINFLNNITLFHPRLLADITLTYNILNRIVNVDSTDIFVYKATIA